MEKNKGYRAVSKNLPISPTKVRPIANHIRKKPYIDALAIPDSLPNKGSLFLKKVISSAASNALNQNSNIDEELLFISELLVDGGPVRKTVWPRSRGRADRLIKRSSHITVVLDTRVAQ